MTFSAEQVLAILGTLITVLMTLVGFLIRVGARQTEGIAEHKKMMYETMGSMTNAIVGKLESIRSDGAKVAEVICARANGSHMPIIFTLEGVPRLLEQVLANQEAIHRQVSAIQQALHLSGREDKDSNLRHLSAGGK